MVVTLRALACEVLTHHPMGRGLRLPFGKYTGLDQIDRLDIIATSGAGEVKLRLGGSCNLVAGPLGEHIAQRVHFRTTHTLRPSVGDVFRHG